MEVTQDATKEAFKVDKTYNNAEIWTMILDTTQTEIWIKDGEASVTNPDTTKRTYEELEALLAKSEELTQAHWTEETWAVLETALDEAKELTKEEMRELEKLEREK